MKKMTMFGLVHSCRVRFFLDHPPLLHEKPEQAEPNLPFSFFSRHSLTTTHRAAWRGQKGHLLGR